MSDNPFVPANQIKAPAAANVTATTTMQLQKTGTYSRGRFVVRGAEVASSKMGPYLKLTLADRFGEVTATCWKGANLQSQLVTGSVVEIAKLQVDDWGPKFEVADLRVLAPGEFRPEDFVKSLPAEQVNAYWEEFHGFLDSIRSVDLQALRKKIWGDPNLAERYKWHTSALGQHHNYMGGNLQHVVGIMRVVEAVCAGYSELDRDLVIFGAAVHDLGKLREYDVSTTITVTDEGRLKGHLVIGAEWISRLAAELRAEGHAFSPRLEEDLTHMILSHHGRGEWGSPKPPATPEAMLLHLADMADSQTKKFLQEVENNAGNAEGWVRKFDPDIRETRWIRTRRDDAA
ncbi:MAG TPA: HD domain-containing protein [Candidatus Thermoplasmatota archaeon]|nr:HD domain-containing protein [Candidatus Thermoplasmatota archaeon]